MPILNDGSKKEEGERQNIFKIKKKYIILIFFRKTFSFAKKKKKIKILELACEKQPVILYFILSIGTIN